MAKQLTVGEIRRVIADLPDDTPVESSMSGSTEYEIQQRFEINLKGLRFDNLRRVLFADVYASYAHCECGALLDDEGECPECDYPLDDNDEHIASANER